MDQGMALELAKKADGVCERGVASDLELTADLFRDRRDRETLLDAAPDARARPVATVQAALANVEDHHPAIVNAGRGFGIHLENLAVHCFVFPYCLRIGAMPGANNHQIS
jgi:hypothetical protein